MNTGKLQVSLALAVWLLLSAGRDTPPFQQLELPAGIDFSVYAEHIENARALTIDDSGALGVRTTDPRISYSIAPASDDVPVMVMQVAQDLQDLTSRSGIPVELAHFLYDSDGSAPVWRESQGPEHTALAPDGSLFVLDRAAGVIYRTRQPAFVQPAP